MRVKMGANALKRKRKVMKAAKGYFGAKSKQYRTAKAQVMRSGNFAYVGRKLEKRNMRQLWIARINAACRLNDVSYSVFMHGLKEANITLNRKVLAEIAVSDEVAFKNLVASANKALSK